MTSQGVAVGIDLVQVSRIAESLALFGARFATRLFTAHEVAYCTEPELAAATQAAEQHLAEMKHVATDAYDGINDSLSELRMSIVLAQETFNKMERTLPDKEVGRKLRDAIDETMNRADEAKGHIRSLRSLIE